MRYIGDANHQPTRSESGRNEPFFVDRCGIASAFSKRVGNIDTRFEFGCKPSAQ